MGVYFNINPVTKIIIVDISFFSKLTEQYKYLTFSVCKTTQEYYTNSMDCIYILEKNSKQKRGETNPSQDIDRHAFLHQNLTVSKENGVAFLFNFHSRVSISFYALFRIIQCSLVLARFR
jgi:hypothetical protein